MRGVIGSDHTIFGRIKGVKIVEREFHNTDIPGITRKDEEKQLARIIQLAQNHLTQAKADIRKLNEDLADLLEVYETKDKEGLALWNNATARLKEQEYDVVRLEKARKKPYFGRIDFLAEEKHTTFAGHFTINSAVYGSS